MRRSRSTMPVLLSFLALVCCLPLAAKTLMLSFSHTGAFCDFTQYWSTGRLFFAHQNPYAIEPLVALQRPLGWPEARPIVAPNPPWSIPLFAAAGILPFAEARELWRILSLVILLGAAWLLWDYFGGAARTRWISLVLALTFLPFGITERIGQITPLILAGLVAFLLLLRSERWVAAGILLLPALGVKPHLFCLVAAAILLWAIQERRWALLGGAVGSTGAACAAVALVDPAAFHYPKALLGHAMAENCGVGGALRIAFHTQHVWVQYLPCAAGAIWFTWYWLQHREHWEWSEHLPLLLLVSIASSPYGWASDYIIALPAFVAVAARGAWKSPLVIVTWLFVQFGIFASPMLGIEAGVSALWIAFWLLARSATRVSPLRQSVAPPLNAHALRSSREAAARVF